MKAVFCFIVVYSRYVYMGCSCNKLFVFLQQDIQESLFAATKALKSELETRVAKVQELLDSNSLPKIIEINRIASLEHGSNAVTNPVLAFDTCNDSQQVW